MPIHPFPLGKNGSERQRGVTGRINCTVGVFLRWMTAFISEVTRLLWLDRRDEPWPEQLICTLINSPVSHSYLVQTRRFDW